MRLDLTEARVQVSVRNLFRNIYMSIFSFAVEYEKQN